MQAQIISKDGELWIRPILTELKHELRYAYKHMPNEDQVIRRSDGSSLKIVRQGTKIAIETRLLYREVGEYLVCGAGLLSRVQKVFSDLGFETTFQHVGRPLAEYKIERGVTVRDLYPEQCDCVASLLSVWGGALAQAPTGAGKTRVIAGIIRAYKHCRIVVATKASAVVGTLYETLTKVLKDDEIELGIYRGGLKVKRPITISTIDLLHYFDPEEVDVLIFDEAHRAGADKTSELVKRFKHSVKYGLSATLEDRFDGKEMYIESLFGPMVFDLLDSEAEELGRICPIKAWILDVPNGPCIGGGLSRIRKEELGIWYNHERNSLIEEVARRAPADQQMVVFVRTTEHAENLKKNYLPEFEIYHAGLPNKVKEQMKKNFENGSLKRMIATNALSEGVDPGNLYIVVDANWEASEVSVVQKAGRNRRFAQTKNSKPYGVVIGFNDSWNERMASKATDRVKRYEKRNYTVFKDARPSEVEFVKMDTSLTET